MLIEMHMLKSFPPTNLNRDEGGSPKTCSYGGAQRGRISSQCLKRAWRRDSEFQKLPVGVRTRYLPDEVAKRLREMGVPEAYIAAVKPKLTAFGNRDAKENDEMNTAQVMFFAPEDIDAVAEEVRRTLEGCETVAAVKEIKVKDWQERLKRLARPITMDMALFGRMITDDSFKNVEAAMQVAHAISTHAVNMESDFFTAVDDLQNTYGEDAGSAMMGDVDFNACCYYLYASLDTDQLYKNLEGSPEVLNALPELLPALLSSMALTNPSGKQNSFAGHVLPSLICVERKERKVPISYVGAFETPVVGHQGYAKRSAEALVQHIDTVDRAYGIAVEPRLWFCPGLDVTPPGNAQVVETLPELCRLAGQWLS